MSVLTFNCVRAGCLQAIEVIKVMLCPDIAVRITAHAAIRKENNLRRIYDDVDVEVVEVEVVEEENISKKRINFSEMTDYNQVSATIEPYAYSNLGEDVILKLKNKK